jgi:hypothetical protein
MLRDERNGLDRRLLWAFLDADGSLHVDGQDLGPGTRSVSDDGEYEWFSTVRAPHVPHLVQLLGGDAGIDVLVLLEERFTGKGSYDLERVLRESGIPVERFVY